jgi:hypothetical protein
MLAGAAVSDYSHWKKRHFCVAVVVDVVVVVVNL